MADFALTVEAFTNKAVAEVKKARKNIQKEIVISITKATPVDTGKAEHSWYGSKGSPIYSTVPTALYMGVKATFGEDGIFYFTNSQPYIRHLEFGLYNHATSRTTPQGFSSQAPAGMVRINLQRISNNIEARYG